jgi:protein TilB
MATLTVDLIRKKAEHHSDLLSSLEELSLHQLNLSSLTPIPASCCPNLRILYLHNYLLSSPSVFKHIARLHLTLNNVTSLPPLTSALSSLNKLDLTLNHISLCALSSSLSSLTANDRLRELYLTGNPCTSWQWCRRYVIARLPALHSLDGVEVTRTERLEADWKMPEMQQDLDTAVVKEEEERAREEKDKEERTTVERMSQC